MSNDDLKLVPTEDLIKEIFCRFDNSLIILNRRTTRDRDDNILKFSGIYFILIGLIEKMKLDIFRDMDMKNPPGPKIL